MADSLCTLCTGYVCICGRIALHTHMLYLQDTALELLTDEHLFYRRVEDIP